MSPRTIYTIILIQASLAMAGSLYFSNFWDPVYEFLTGTWFDTSDSFYPCQLCWWARIMMYPIVPLSILGLVKKNKDILLYIFLISIPGILLESFHYLMQKPQIIGRANIENPFGCTLENPCAALKVDYLGFITIPFLCLVAFTVIFTVSLIGLKKWKK